MMVLTATAVSMIAGKIQAVVLLYPMACIRSRSARKLTANAPTPMAATALTARVNPARGRDTPRLPSVTEQGVDH